MIIVADRNMAALEETFGRHGELRLFDGRSMRRADLVDADVLLVRSVTRVDADLLDGTPVGFVGTATIGTDHLDTAWLDAAGVTWASAPGCNADAAAQYTLAMTLLALRRLETPIAGLRVGIVGHGNVGARLGRLWRALGATVLANDPPLEARGVSGLAALDATLACRVVSLHVPLTSERPWPTRLLANAATLSRMPAGALLVNASRGDVVDGAALLAEIARGRLHAALDVWPGEPRLDPALLSATTVATPHVAGYSVEGKRRGTTMIYEAFRTWQDLPAEPTPRPEENAGPALDVHDSPDPVTAAVLATTGVEADDAALRAAPRTVEAFDRLRRACGPRHEFSETPVRAPRGARATLGELGFRALPPDTATASGDAAGSTR